MDRKTRPQIYSEAGELIREDATRALAYQQMDICGVNERVNWKARPDERSVVFDMSFKK